MVEVGTEVAVLVVDDDFMVARIHTQFVERTPGFRVVGVASSGQAALDDMRPGDTLVVWKLDRLARSLKQLIETVEAFGTRDIGLRSLTEAIDTTTPGGKLIFHLFAALAEFERALIVERTKAGIAAARARGRNGGAPFKMTAAKLRLAQAAMGQPETKIAPLCCELGISRQTLYRHVSPNGVLREHGAKLLGQQT